MAIALPLLAAATLAFGTPVEATGPEWLTFMGGIVRTDFNSAETTINTTTAAGLKVAWTAHAPAAGSPAAANIFSQPIVASSVGLVYWGSFNGYEYATNMATGATVWSQFLGQTTDTNCFPPTVGVVSTATFVGSFTIGTYSGPVLFVGGGNANVYALAAQTIGSFAGGTVLWQYSTGPSPSTFVWSSPAFYKGSLYIGVASFCDEPLVQGKLLQLNAATGAVAHEFDVVPTGCVGGSVWSSPTIDVRGIGNGGSPTVYVSTGNPGACSTAEPYSEAIVELSAANVANVLGYWTVPLAERGSDTDFGATPTLQEFSAGGTTYHRVGLINKNGTYYEFARGALGSGPRWRTKLSSSVFNESSSAFDGSRLYVAGAKTAINGTTCAGSLNALNPVNGSVIWRRCISGHPPGEVMAVPGVAAVGEGHYILLVATATGQTLFRYNDSLSTFWGTPTISHGVLYEGDNAGNLFALK